MPGKIERIELFHVDVRLPSPLFPAWIPGYPQTTQRYTLLSVSTKDGLTGYATCPALDRERQGLGEYIAQFLMGLDPYDVDSVRERLRQTSFLGWRNNWIDIAFWDLAAKARDVPLHELLVAHLGGEAEAAPAPDAVPVYASFCEVRPPRVRAEALERAMGLGFTGAKLSVGRADADADREQVTHARAVVGPDFELMAHAHQAWKVSLVEEVPRWDVARARAFFDVAAEAGLRWVQEPLHDEAWDELAELRAAAPLPLAGGDLTFTFVPIRALVQGGCYSILTPDAVFSGLGNVARTVGVCRDTQLGFSPSSYGDGIGLAANLHALVAYRRLTGDAEARLEMPWEPPALTPAHRDALLDNPWSVRGDGTVAVPTGPGLGVHLDARALRRYATRFFASTPVRLAVRTAREKGLDRTADFMGHGERKRGGSGVRNLG